MATVVVGLQVLDTLTNQLDETLEVVLSRGDSLRLDNKVSKQIVQTVFVLIKGHAQ